MMKTFKDFMGEMARPTGEPFDSKKRYRTKEWAKVFKEDKKFIVFLSDVKPKYKLYQYSNTFILTNKEDDYISHIDTHEIDVKYNDNRYKALKITDGFAKVRGTYIILLLSVLNNIKNAKFIFSDIMLSDGAIKFYDKVLKKGGPFKSYVLRYGEVKKPDKDTNYFKDNSYQVGLSLLNNHINETIKELETVRDNDMMTESQKDFNTICLLYGINNEDSF